LYPNLDAARQKVRSFFGPIQCGPSGLRIVESKQVILTRESDGLTK